MTVRRSVKAVFQSKPTIEGAGVHLRRGFGFGEVPLFDPFLMFDDFRCDAPDKFLKGFPWHPHRGIETITYVTRGDVEHADSLGNQGVISSGDVQWMTAGSGIIHHEMPKGDSEGKMFGFQLWANLPAADKMRPPRYRDILAKDIPLVKLDDGVCVRVICGHLGDVAGPVRDIVIDPEYLDVTLPAQCSWVHPTHSGHKVFAYVTEGRGSFCSQHDTMAANTDVVLYDDGEEVCVRSGEEPLRFLLVSGAPIGEPVAWQGPIVMNTQEELRQAFEEYQQGTFIKHE